MSFPAQYVGVCHCGCGERFDRETLINRTIDGEYVIEGHEQRERADRNAVCSKCYLVHAGECF